MCHGTFNTTQKTLHTSQHTTHSTLRYRSQRHSTVLPSTLVRQHPRHQAQLQHRRRHVEDDSGQHEADAPAAAVDRLGEGARLSVEVEGEVEAVEVPEDVLGDLPDAVLGDLEERGRVQWVGCTDGQKS